MAASPSPRALLTAATRPVSLLVLLGSAALGWGLDVAALPAIGALAFTALVAFEVMGADGPKGLGERKATQLPSPSDIRDPSVKYVVADLHHARKELDRVIGETATDVVSGVSDTLRRVDELWAHSVGLITQAEELGAYLASQKRGDVEEEIKRLDARIRETRDASARAEYEKAKQTRRAQQETLDRIEGARDRILAHLSGIQATVEGIGPKIVHMRALDEEERRTITLNVSRELDRTNQEVGALESSLQGLLELSRQ